MHMIRSWQFSLFIKLLKILQKLKLTSFVSCSSYIMMIILCWYYSAVIMPDKEKFYYSSGGRNDIFKEHIMHALLMCTSTINIVELSQLNIYNNNVDLISYFYIVFLFNFCNVKNIFCDKNIFCLIVKLDAKVVVDVFKNPNYVNHIISPILDG